MLPESSDKTHYEIKDAQRFIEATTQQFDLIVVDIFTGSESPKWLLQPQTLYNLSLRLSPQGAIAWNLLIENETEFSHFYGQLREQFRQQTLCLESEENENILAYALNFTPTKYSMSEHINLAHELADRYSLPMHTILSVIYSINPVDSGVI